MSYQARLDQSERYEIVYQDLDLYETTFKGKLQAAIQSWYRLTPSYSPDLVNMLFKKMGIGLKDKVLDPFVGTGTTLIECKFEDINSIGVEINPIFYEVAKVSTYWEHDIHQLEQVVETYLTQVANRCKEVRGIPLGSFPSKLGIELPKIYNVNRWWRDDVLRDLLIARELVSKQNSNHEIKQFLRVGLMCILIDVANIAHMHPTLTFVDRSNDNIDVLANLSTKLRKMVSDLKKVQHPEKWAVAQVILGDSTKIASLVPKDEITCVITSPPYPNRISYVWETRPHLYFFKIFNRPTEAGLLDCDTIGGTWGRATSILQNGVIKPCCPDVDRGVTVIADLIRTRNQKDSRANLMANYVMKYFNMMYKHFEELAKVAKSGCQCAYIVGNSRIKGVEVPTDLVLADLFESVGFKTEKIIRTRKRIGRKNLYEAIVYTKLT